jgi:hypothetical protein
MAEALKQPTKVKEMSVITKAKDLSIIVFEVCETSPKKFRLSLIEKMQNLSLEIIAKLYEANDVFMDISLIRDINKSLDAIGKGVLNQTETQEYHEKMKTLILRLTKAIKTEERVGRRLDCSFRALTLLKELDHVVTIAKKMNCITTKQQERLAASMNDVQNLIGAFIKSDRKRYDY